MTSLYNCKHSGDQYRIYRITKFTSDFEVEASYLCGLTSCECPAGHRPSCRHRLMLPKFIQRDAIGTSWFLDFDRGGWVQGWKEEPATNKELDSALDTIMKPGFGEPAAQPLQGQPQREPYGVGPTLTDGLPLAKAVNELTIAREITLPSDATLNEVAEAFNNLLASAALPIQPEPEPSPTFHLGGFPDHCLSNGECTTPDDCILNGCAHGHGTPSREPSPSSPLPSPTIRRRV